MDRKILWVGVGSLLLLGLAFAGFRLFQKPEEFRGTAYVEPYPIAADFELTRSNGDLFRLSDQGKVILLFFGYTSCPDVCPTTLAELNLALNQISEKADQIEVVFVSVDPDRDSPQVVQSYVSRFNPAFIGLSGSIDQLNPIWQEYGIYREVVDDGSAAGPDINHTARITVMDKQGHLRLSYAYDTPLEDIVHDLNLILK